MMTLIRKVLLLFLLSFLLCGCACGPEHLGIDKLAWESYSQERQKSLLSSYTVFAKERKDLLKGQEKKNFGNVFLEVSVSGGKMMFPPKFVNWQNYQTISFNLFKEQCLDVTVSHYADSNTQTVLGVCYLNDNLYLDPSRYDPTKKFGTVTIHFSPLWMTGFTYQGIDSSGYVKLNNVNVKIIQKELELASRAGTDAS